MDDLISRVYVLAEYDRQHQGPPGGARKIMAEAPAVDAVPVIRCASCKWWNGWNGSTLGAAHRCAALHIATTGEFYCAAAERKSNAFADQSGADYADNPTV